LLLQEVGACNDKESYQCLCAAFSPLRRTVFLAPLASPLSKPVRLSPSPVPAEDVLGEIAGLNHEASQWGGWNMLTLSHLPAHGVIHRRVCHPTGSLSQGWAGEEAHVGQAKLSQRPD
jgi:hypothetical protein